MKKLRFKNLYSLLSRLGFFFFGVYCAYLLYMSESPILASPGSYITCGIFSIGLGFIFGVILNGAAVLMIEFFKHGLFEEDD